VLLEVGDYEKEREKGEEEGMSCMRKSLFEKRRLRD